MMGNSKNLEDQSLLEPLYGPPDFWNFSSSLFIYSLLLFIILFITHYFGNYNEVFNSKCTSNLE